MVERANTKKHKFVKLELSLLNNLKKKEEPILIFLLHAPDFERRPSCITKFRAVPITCTPKILFLLLVVKLVVKFS